MEPRNRIVICGESQDDVARWSALALEFSFDLEFVPTIFGLGQLQDPHTVSSVFVALGASERSVTEMSEQIRAHTPNARVLASRPMASSLSAADLTEAGVFHSVRQPIHACEMRQSLGFLWSALKQDAAIEKEADSASTDLGSIEAPSASLQV
jgi:hypothetical protein